MVSSVTRPILALVLILGCCSSSFADAIRTITFSDTNTGMLHIDDPGAIGGARSADMLERQVTNTNRFVYSTDVLPGVIRNYNVTVSLQINEPNATISDRLALTTIRGIQ